VSVPWSGHIQSHFVRLPLLATVGGSAFRAVWLARYLDIYLFYVYGVDDEPQCSDPVTSSGVVTVTCDVTLNASNIHKSLESLEVQPTALSTSANCSVTDNVTLPANQSATLRRFILQSCP